MGGHVKLYPTGQILAFQREALVPIDQRMRHIAVEGHQLRIEPVNPMTAEFVLRGLGDEMVADVFDLSLSVPDTHHAGGQSGYIGSEFAVLLAAHLAPEGLEDRIGWNRNPSSDRT